MLKIEVFQLFFRLVHQNVLIFGLSTNWSLRPQESRSSVRPSVRSCVTLFLGNRSLIFYETLQLVRACRCEKNVPSAFLKILTVFAILAKNCPKWPFFGVPKMEVFSIFFQNRTSEFPNFLLEAQSLESKDNYVFTFWWKFQKWPCLAKIDPNLT